MASTKHELPLAEDEPVTKRTKLSVAETQTPRSEELKHQRVELNPADCNLDFNIEGNGLRGHALYEQGFAYCWSGARANVGIKGGKYCFGCKVISEQHVEMEDTPLDQQHVCRVGISRGDDAVGNLGETEHSLGYGGTGKFSKSGRFSDYGEKFGVGDTIVCGVDIDSESMASIGFSKNGKWLGTAMRFDVGTKGFGLVNSQVRELKWETAVFPHVLLKNVVVQMQFSVEDGLVPEEGYEPWNCAFEQGNAISGPSFSNPRDCELMMLVGLPASGKTTWAEKWIKEHPKKRYVLLGTNLALDQMKVPGLLRKNNYGERFDRLMNRATGIFNTLLTRASKTPHNYIIDQTNVYKSARKRKLRPFSNYRKIAVVTFPRPDELKNRAAKRFAEMGKEVPAEAVNEMLANYLLPMSKDMPGSDEFFDQIMFTELDREESQRYLDDMKLELRSASNNLNRSIPTYSRESIKQSYGSPITQKQGSLSGTGGPWQNSPSPLPPVYNQQIPQHVSSTYSGSGLHLHGDYRSVSVDPNCLIPTNSPQGNYSSYSSDPLPRVADPYGRPNLQTLSPFPGVSTNSNQNCGRIDPYWGPYSGSRNTPAGSADPYRSSAVVEQSNIQSYQTRDVIPSGGTDFYHGRLADACYRPNLERETLYGYNYGSPRASLMNSRAGGYAGEPRYSVQAPSEFRFQAHDPLPASYGSPYVTPPGRPSYGNVSANNWQQHSAGYSGPGPRHY